MDSNLVKRSVLPEDAERIEDGKSTIQAPPLKKRFTNPKLESYGDLVPATGFSF